MKKFDKKNTLFFKSIALFFFLTCSTVLNAQVYYELYRNGNKIYGPATKEQCDNQKQERIKQDAVEELRKAKEYADQYKTLDVPNSPKVNYEIKQSHNASSGNTNIPSSGSTNSVKIGGAPNVSAIYPTKTYTPSTRSISDESTEVILTAAAVAVGAVLISRIISANREAREAEERAKIEEEQRRIAYNEEVTKNTYNSVSSELIGLGNADNDGFGTSFLSDLGLITDFEIKDENIPFNPLAYSVDELFEEYCTNFSGVENISILFEEYYKKKTGRDIEEILNKTKLDDNDRTAIEEYNNFVINASKDLSNEVYYYKNQINKQELDMAVIANDIYNPGKSISGYTDYVIIDEPEKAGEMQGIVDAINKLNGFRDEFYAKVYYNQANQQYVISFRGSTNALNDWKENAKNASDEFSDKFASEQYASAAMLGKLIKDLPPEVKSRISFTGHSQGGGQASLAGAITGLKTYTFNAAGVDYESKDYHNISAFYSKYDPLNKIQDNKEIQKKLTTYIPIGAAIAQCGSYKAKTAELISFAAGQNAHENYQKSDELNQMSSALMKIAVKGYVPEAIGTRIEIDNSDDFQSVIPKGIPGDPILKEIKETEKYIHFHSMDLMQMYFEKKESKQLDEWIKYNNLQKYIEIQVSDTDKLLKKRRLIDVGKVDKQ